MEPFETNRLLLRPLTITDLDDLHNLYSRLRVMKYITGNARSYQKTGERLRHHISDHQQYGFGLCAAILKETGEMIGRCGMEPVEEDHGMEGDIAWMFLPEYWGQGLATEFGTAQIEYGFKRLGLVRIFATANRDNLASIRVMEKLGMRLAGASDQRVEYEIFPDSAT
ncbi:MAG: GNAT family N-acetyltransferase [Anaerolineales bacterium]|nr:GNAT family N-acetyltransferase [Anaerolineales bacterium]